MLQFICFEEKMRKVINLKAMTETINKERIVSRLGKIMKLCIFTENSEKGLHYFDSEPKFYYSLSKMIAYNTA